MKRNPISSPCIAVCQFEEEVCTACFRTRDEAYMWYELSDEARDIAWDRFIQKYNQNEETQC
jgi:predicted Fe-S protein YdhL (DUF1289 family)